ncbi:RmlD substrate binding domain-containing protein [Pasteurella langaaensis DSM 22999]|uniref:dTDP-4-dehydrorhamnose reductase n=1 Tax=Alitibacter langaaensis DSM 22999 TaxID=1122935 RepID=A0A2U0TH73_9PAST|nr:RmlD substrate binding domain-containing protein [Pasteurella langaaensis DSM 22999]
MLRLGKEREVLGVVGDQLGGPTYAGDIACALIQIANQIIAGRENVFGVYHFSGQPYVSWYEFAEHIFTEALAQKLLEKRPHLNCITTSDYPTPAKRPANSCLNLDKIKNVFWNCTKRLAKSFEKSQGISLNVRMCFVQR